MLDAEFVEANHDVERVLFITRWGDEESCVGNSSETLNQVQCEKLLQIPNGRELAGASSGAARKNRKHVDRNRQTEPCGSACKQHEALHQISDGEEFAGSRYVSSQGDFGKGKFSKGSKGKFCKGMLNKVKFPAVLFIYAPEGNAAQQGCSGKYVVTSETGPDGNPTWKHSEDADLLLVRSDQRWCVGNIARWEDGPVINSSQGPEDLEISSTWVRRHDDVGLEHTAVYITSHANKIPKLRAQFWHHIRQS